MGDNSSELVELLQTIQTHHLGHIFNDSHEATPAIRERNPRHSDAPRQIAPGDRLRRDFDLGGITDARSQLPHPFVDEIPVFVKERLGARIGEPEMTIGFEHHDRRREVCQSDPEELFLVS